MFLDERNLRHHHARLNPRGSLTGLSETRNAADRGWSANEQVLGVTPVLGLSVLFF
jgi:hypothetical protein